MHMHTNKTVLDVRSGIAVFVVAVFCACVCDREKEGVSVLNRSNPGGVTSSVRSLPFR